MARLVEAAQMHFGIHGYSGARMTEIAEAAGITHSSIYQYFASKRDLYGAAFDVAQTKLLPQYADAIAAHDTLREQIKAIFVASARTHAGNPTVTPFLASIPVEIRRHPDLLPSLQADGGRLMGPLSTMFAAARGRGEITSEADDLDLLIAFIGAAMGVGLLSYGMANEKMDSAVDILLAVIDGNFFKG